MQQIALWHSPCIERFQTKQSPYINGEKTTPGSSTMYLFFTAPAVSLVTILAMTLHSQFSSRPNL